MSDDLYTFVAGRALEHDETFDVRCNCGGTAPISPTSTAGYGFSKRGPLIRVVDKLESECTSCGTKIIASVLEGDPGYVLTRNNGHDQLFSPQGSSSKPVSSLSPEKQQHIIAQMKRDAGQGD